MSVFGQLNPILKVGLMWKLKYWESVHGHHVYVSRVGWGSPLNKWDFRALLVICT